MRSTQARLVLVIIVFVAALAGGLLLMQGSKRGDSGSGTSEPGRASAAAESDVWAVGDTWTIGVRQDAAAITPDGDRSIATIPFRFEVAEAPKDAKDAWLVRVSQDGAEGPFAAGWRLWYRAKGDTLVLHQVAVGSEPPLEAQLASIVLGPQFPYEVEYSAPPKDATVNADALLDRAELPPGALPDGAPNAPAGATPPAEAPKLDAGGAPEGAPNPR